MQKMLTAGSVIFLLLVLVNIGLFTSNRTQQNEVNLRAQYIQESLTLEKVYQPLVQALAELAASRNDAQIKTLLNEQGINFSVNPAVPPVPASR
jgi:hypothetical protein